MPLLFRARFALFIAAWFVCQVSLAKTYYLAPGGSDSSGRNGSSAQPWRSINYAMGKMNNSDDLVLKAGTYWFSSTQRIWRSGSSSNRVVVRAANNANVVLEFGGINTQWDDAINISGRYVTFKGIDVRNNQRGAGIMVNASNVIVDSCDSYDHGSTSIQIWGNTSNWNATPNNCIIRYCAAWNCCRMNDPDFWNYQGWQEQGGFWPGAITGLVARNVKIQHCWSGQNYGEGIFLSRVRGSNSEITNCYARDNFSVNIYVDSTSGSSNKWVLIENNTAECTYLSDYYRNGNAASNFVVAAENYDGNLVGSNRTRYISMTGNTARNGAHNFWVADFGKAVSDVWVDGNDSSGGWFSNWKLENSSRIWNIWVGSNSGF